MYLVALFMKRAESLFFSLLNGQNKVQTTELGVAFLLLKIIIILLFSFQKCFILAVKY